MNPDSEVGRMRAGNPSPLKPGDVVARRYVVLRHLRDEPCGNVWLAQDRTLAEDVALKFLPRTALQFDRLREALRQEAALALKLRHPAILQILHYNEGDEGVYLVQEPFQGESLLAHLNRLERFHLPTALDLLEQVAEALAVAHEQHVVHQSFNPLNLLVAENRVKVINFSCPVPEEADPQVSHLELKAYVAPETLQGEPITPAANVFSLGVLGFRLAAGSLPYPLTFDEPLPYRLEDMPVDLGEIPLPLQNLLLQCLAPHPRDRFEDAGAFLKALGQRRESWRTPSPMRWTRRGGGEESETAGLKAAASRALSRLRQETGQARSWLREGLQKLKEMETPSLARRLLLGLAGLTAVLVVLVWRGRSLWQRPETPAPSAQIQSGQPVAPPSAVSDLKLPPVGGPPLSAGPESALTQGPPKEKMPPAPAAPVAKPPPPANREAYQVVVATVSGREEAKAIKKRLEGKNIPVMISRAVAGKKTFFLVKAGPFPERQQAEELAKRLRIQEGLSHPPRVVKVSQNPNRAPASGSRP